MNKFTVKRLTDSTIEITFYDVTKKNLPRALLTGDRHHDNPRCDRRLEKKHLTQALKYNAPTIDVGDAWDLMQGKYDPRKTYTGLREEYSTGEEYLDLVEEEGVEFYKPFGDILALFSKGNHESSVLKRVGTNIPKRVAKGIRRETRNRWPFYGNYAGWVIFRFLRPKGNLITSLSLKYHHGYGGGGPVTKGVIQTNRRAVYLPDAAVIVTAHIHEAWALPIIQERVSQQGVSSQRVAWHISTPTYQNDYGDGTDGYHVEQGRPPKPMGCVWLNFELYNKSRRVRIDPKLVIAQES